MPGVGAPGHYCAWLWLQPVFGEKLAIPVKESARDQISRLVAEVSSHPCFSTFHWDRDSNSSSGLQGDVAASQSRQTDRVCSGGHWIGRQLCGKLS